MVTVELYHGDCLSIMPTLPAGQIDAIITDLPYGSTACKWDEVIPFAPMWDEANRLLGPNGAFVTTASQPFTSRLIQSNLAGFRHCWIWDKKLAGNFLLAKRQPLKVHEDICVFGARNCTYNPQMRFGIMRQKGGGFSNLWSLSKTTTKDNDYYPISIIEVGNTDRNVEHPTQKPVDLFKYLIRTYTNEGDTVLDVCAGSGTTGVAAVQTGRNFIGIEIDPAYFAIAQRRIAEAQAQLSLFPPAAIAEPGAARQASLLW